MANKNLDRHYHISSKHRLLDLKLKDTWEYRDLIVLFVHRNISVTYKQTILGPAWLFIRPLLTSIMHMILFGQIAKLSTDGVPMLLFYLVGTTIWDYFNYCLTTNSNVFSGNGALFGKVYFPRLTVPIATTISGMIRFIISIIPVVVVMLYYCVNGYISFNPLYWIMIPILLIWIGLMAMGCGMIISSLTTKYKDLSVLVSFGMTLWMYGTPVAYPLSQLTSGLLRQIIIYNPMTFPLELFKFILFGKGTMIISSMLISICFTIVAVVLGIIVFNKVERTFIDTI